MWEYKVVEINARVSFKSGQRTPFEDEVNELGRDNWELVAAMPSQVGLGGTTHFLLMFKRQCS